MARPAISFGLQDYPDTVTTVWGARWIYPDDMLPNRQDFANMETEDGQRLKNWLDTVGIFKAMEGARRLAGNSMTRQSDKTVVLYEDETGIIKGNPQGSHGYLYVCGYLKAEGN